MSTIITQALTKSATLFAGRARRNHSWFAEWYLFHRVGWQCAAWLKREDDLLLHVSIPWLFSVYLHLPPVFRLKETWRLGAEIHHNSIWFYTFSSLDGWSRNWPWWRKGFSLRFPWDLVWVSTEILDQNCTQVVYAERRGSRDWEAQKKAEALVSATTDYRYQLKSGEIQERRAKFFVERHTWKALAWPLIPIKKVRTSISVTFSDEVGERTGSWKGGCVGCGYDLLPGETPIQCLRRMERERKFD